VHSPWESTKTTPQTGTTGQTFTGAKKIGVLPHCKNAKNSGQQKGWTGEEGDLGQLIKMKSRGKVEDQRLRIAITFGGPTTIACGGKKVIRALRGEKDRGTFNVGGNWKNTAPGNK